ncbi:MAG TPA: aminotransferase class V-fold PLP-dependent enzyme [Phycisphaerae bacterium]|nr:aminotransferase class V-fold PLP-dependent enzyme [Phycisphaerae bacterium]
MADVIYFDNAATSWPKPSVVTERMTSFLASEAANPGRAGHRMAVGAEKMLDGVRKLLTDFVGGKDHHRMIFTMNGTDALNIAMKGLLRAGDHVITTTLEHNSVSRPLQAMADGGFITLTRVDFSPETGVIDPADVKKAITPKTRLIVVTHGSNVVGTIQPVAEVGRIAREHKILFLVDAAQTIGTVPIDIHAMHIDVLAFPGHKSLLGPTGTGGLYVNSTVSLDAFHAFREGGTGGDSSSPTMPKLFPYFLEGGTPNTVGIAGLGAAVEYVVKHDPAKTLAKEQGMVQRVIDVLLSNPKFKLHGPKTAGGRVGTLSFSIEGYSPQEAGSILDESFNIAVRPGLHCSPYAHKTLGTFPDGAVRVSPGHFNTEEELAALLDALQQLAG